MKPKRIKPYERVALTRDMPEEQFYTGDVAVVVDDLPVTVESDGEGG